MNFFKKIVSAGASTLVDSLGKAIDSCVTSDEERLKLKAMMESQSHDFEVNMEQEAMKFEGEVSARHLADMNSDSWLSKNIRPMSLIFLLVTTMGLAYGTIFGSLPPEQTEMLKAWIPLLITLDTTAVGFYFGGRSLEKRTKFNIQ